MESTSPPDAVIWPRRRQDVSEMRLAMPEDHRCQDHSYLHCCHGTGRLWCRLGPRKVNSRGIPSYSLNYSLKKHESDHTLPHDVTHHARS